jgi:hypothetical protein
VAELQNAEGLQGRYSVRRSLPELGQVPVQGGWIGPRLQRLGMIQGTRTLLEQRQVVEQVQDVLLALIAAGKESW